MNLISSIIEKVKQKAQELGKVVSDNEGWIRQGKLSLEPLKNTRTWAEGARNVLSILPGGQPLSSPIIKDTATKHIENWYVKPLANLPSSAKKLISPSSTLKQRGEGALGVLSGLSVFVPDPIFDVGIPATYYLKGYQKATLEKKPFQERIKSAIQSGTLEKPVGLGEALSTDPTTQTIGNLAEIPLTFLVAGKVAKLGKGKEAELLKNVSQAVKEGKITVEEGQAILGVLKEKPKIKIKAPDIESTIKSQLEEAGVTTPPPQKIRIGESGGVPTSPEQIIKQSKQQLQDAIKKEEIQIPSTPPPKAKQLNQKSLLEKSLSSEEGITPPPPTTSNPYDNYISNLKEKVNKIYTDVLDRFHPISKLGKEAGEEIKIRNALTGYYGAGSTANYHIDFELSPILKEQNYNDLKKVAIALRDKELASRGIQGSNTGITIDTLKKELGEEKLNSIKSTLQKLYQYQDNIVKKYLVDTGIIKKEVYEKMRKNNQFYVPFKRVMDVVDENLGLVPQKRGAGSVSSQDIIYKIKGSKKEIIDPIESIIENTYKTVGLGKRQEVAKAIVSLKDKLPEGTIKEIKGNIGKKPNISLFENGKVKHYLVPPEVADAAKGLSEEGLNTLIKILSYPTKFFRATATGINPEFMLPNIARDLQSAFINVGLNPLGWIKGLAHMLKKDELYQEFLKYGGRSTTSIALDRPMLQKTAQEITGSNISKGITMLRPSNIIKTLQTLGEYSETPTRLAVFEQEFLKGLKKGLSKEEAAQQAAYWAQEATVNFARRGAKTQSANSLYAFLNARAQGIDRLLRTIKNDPKGAVFRLGLITQLPAIGLYAWNRRFDSYFDPRVVSDNDKNNNFIIMLSDEPIPLLGGAQFIKIPKAEIGKLANPTEQFLSFLDGKGGDTKKALVSLLKAFSPIDNVGDLIPTTFRTPIEIAANKSFFYNQPIVPEYKTSYPAKYQDTSYTAPLYRMIGQQLNISPAKIQALVEGYGTGLAKMGELMTRPFIPEQYKTEKNKQGQPINRTPILRRFLGGEKRTEEEQALSDIKRKQSIEFQINDIKSAINKGDIPKEEGIKKIEELRQEQQKITTQTTNLSTNNYIRFISGDKLVELNLSKITPSEKDTNMEKALKLKKAYSYVDEILDSDLSTEEQAKYLSMLGISPEDASYYNIARQPDDIKYIYVKDEIEKYGDNRQEILLNLIKLRREVNNKIILSNKVIDDLTDEGLLSQEEAKYLKNTKYTKTGEVKVKLIGRGRAAKLKAIKLAKTSFKARVPKLKPIEIGGIRKSGKISGRGRILKVRKISYK